MAEEGVLGSGLGLLTDALAGTTRTAVSLAGGLLTGQQNLSYFSGAVVDAGTMFGNTVGKVVHGMVQFAEGTLQEYQNLTAIGATFGKEITEMKVTAAQLGLSVEEMTNFIRDNNRSLRAFGGTTDQAINRFRALSTTVLDSAELGTQLRRLGFTTADINENLALYGELTDANSRRDRLSVEQQAEAAKGLMVELDGLAKLTGKQRQQLADEMRDRRRQGDVNAFLMGKTAEEQQAFVTELVKIQNTLGQDAADAFVDIALRGAPTTEATRGAMLAMGNAANDLYSAASAFNSGSISQFESAVDGMIGSAVDYQRTEEFRNAAILGGVNSTTAAFANASAGAYDITNAIDSTAGANESAADALTRLQNEIQEEQLHQMQTQTGIIDETIAMQESLRNLTVEVMEQTIPRLEDMAVAAIGKFRDAMPTSEELANRIGSTIENAFNIAEGIDNPTQPFTDLLNGLGSGMQEGLAAHDAATGEDIGALGDAMGTEIVDPVNAVTEETVASTQAALEEAQAASDRARSEAEAELAAAQQRLDSLTASGFESTDGRVVEAQQMVEQAQTALDAAIAEGNASVINAINAANRAAAMATSARLPTTSAGTPDWRFAPRRAGGGSIGSDEWALVGESGAEFVRGPGEVTSARDSNSILNSLVSSIQQMNSGYSATVGSSIDALSSLPKSLSQIETGYSTTVGSHAGIMSNLAESLSQMNSSNMRLQNIRPQELQNTQDRRDDAQNEISTFDIEGPLQKILGEKFDTMIAQMGSLLDVEYDVIRTQKKNLKATKGLSGNMLRGV